MFQTVLDFVVKLPLLIFAVLYEGLVFSYLWLWFVAKTFDAPELGVMQSVGLMLIAEPLMGSSESDDEKSPIETFMTQCLAASLVWGAGWIVSLCL